VQRSIVPFHSLVDDVTGDSVQPDRSHDHSRGETRLSERVSAHGFHHTRGGEERAGSEKELHLGTLELVIAVRAARSNGSRPGRAQWLALAAVAGFSIVADQLTKQLIAGQLAAGTTVDAFGPLWFSHTDNTGFALGLLEDRRWLLPIATVLVVAATLAYFARIRRSSAAVSLSLGLIVGGSSANLIDRVFVGHVTDFVGIHLSPVFNLADVFIALGIAILIGREFFVRPPRLFGR